MLRIKEYTGLEHAGYGLRDVRTIAVRTHAQKHSFVFGLLVGGIMSIADCIRGGTCRYRAWV